MFPRLAGLLLGMGLVVAARPARAATACSEAPLPAVSLPEQLSFGDFWNALGAEVDALDKSALRPSFEAFAARHGADATNAQLWREFARLWLAFEATRDGGFWRL